jgi:chromosomal replication initiation ATPase DnaA
MTDPQSHFNTMPDTARDVFRQVAKAYGVTVWGLLSDDRHRGAAQARQALYAALYDLRLPNGQRRFSMPQIASMTARADHSTVHHGLRAHAERMQGRAA